METIVDEEWFSILQVSLRINRYKFRHSTTEMEIHSQKFMYIL
jgi:hypothetical protein